jgi:hypothetical protein
MSNRQCGRKDGREWTRPQENAENYGQEGINVPVWTHKVHQREEKAEKNSIQDGDS